MGKADEKQFIDIKYTQKILILIIKKYKEKGNNFSNHQINFE